MLKYGIIDNTKMLNEANQIEKIIKKTIITIVGLYVLYGSVRFQYAAKFSRENLATREGYPRSKSSMENLMSYANFDFLHIQVFPLCQVTRGEATEIRWKY